MREKDAARDRARHLVSALGLFLLVGGAHLAGTELAISVNKNTSQGVSLFPAAGVTVAALLMVRRSQWWIVLVATMAAEFGANIWRIDDVFWTAFGSALSNVVEPLLGATVVLMWLGHRPALQKPRELVVYVVGAVVCGPILGTLVGVTSTQFTPRHSEFWDVAGRWFPGDALGVLVFGSFVLVWFSRDVLQRRPWRMVVEVAALVATLVLVTWLAFWGTVPTLAYATLPVLGWAAIRFGVRGATAGGVIVAALADWATVTNHGLFYELSKDQPHDSLAQLQLFLGVVLLTSLLLASQVAELEATGMALRAAEETRRFQVLLESSPDPVVILNVDGAIEYVNKQFQQLVAADSRQLVGTHVATLLPSVSRDAVGRAIADAVQRPEGSRTVFELVDLGGVGRTFETAVSPLLADRGKVLVATLREITERLRAEEATLQALAAAEQATQAKSDFLAMMSHEIRTPMNGVIGMVDILSRMSLEGDHRQIVGTISESAEALLAVINDILDFSKIEAGKLAIESAPFDLRDLVDGVTEVLASTASSKNVELTCEIADDVPPHVIGDSVRLRQVIFNLLGNAVKFTGEGSVRLIVTRTDDGICVAVSDTGIGMTPEQREGLFEPFVQAEQSTTRRFGGSGLGLAIVARLVDLMHGSIAIESEPDHGSTFRVTLPIPAAETPADKPARLDGLRILALTAPDPAPVVHVIVRSLLLEGADVTTLPLNEFRPETTRAGVDYDVLYVTRGTREVAGAHGGRGLDQIVPDLASAEGTVVVSDRTVEGSSWLPHASPVSTSALTGRAVVRAVALACGRALELELTGSAAVAARPISEDGPLILVAEDHPTNRIVIKRQLRLLGFSCLIAGDGVEALELLEQHDFALLLADCHMPRLDGFELTRRIRAAESGSDRRLPIVALTASALPSEADRCIEAGMDLVLTKPVALDALDRALSPWLEHVAAPAVHAAVTDAAVTDAAVTEAAAKAATGPSPNGTSPNGSSEPVVNLAVLRDLLGDDPVAVREVTANFMSSATVSAALLDEADAAGDTQAVRSAAHRLLGGARTVGAARLVEACERIESASDTPDQAMIERLRLELDLVLGALLAPDNGTGEHVR